MPKVKEDRHLFGWCVSGHHAKEDGTGCKGSYLPFHVETIKGKTKIVYADYKELCECVCHKEKK